MGLRNLLVTLFFGIFLGAMAAPLADSVALYRTYGAERGVVFNELECLSFAMSLPSEVALAKTMGVTKRQYFNYLESNISASHDPRAQMRLDQILLYIDWTWHSADFGKAVIDQCFNRAAKASTPKMGV